MKLHNIIKLLTTVWDCLCLSAFSHEQQKIKFFEDCDMHVSCKINKLKYFLEMSFVISHVIF